MSGNLKKILQFIVCISIPLLVGATAGIATSSNIKSWYLDLNKPWFNPPNWIFGPVWTVLYLLMGISLFIIIQRKRDELRDRAVIGFAVQLVLNFIWSFLFFEFRLLGFAFVEILILLLAIVWMFIVFFPVNKMAAYLQIPYFLWVNFATILNGSIWYLNM